MSTCIWNIMCTVIKVINFIDKNNLSLNENLKITRFRLISRYVVKK